MDSTASVPDADGGPVNPAALSVEQVARMLKLDRQSIDRHVADGAPTHSGGRINLVAYAAWLVAQLDGR